MRRFWACFGPAVRYAAAPRRACRRMRFEAQSFMQHGHNREPTLNVGINIAQQGHYPDAALDPEGGVRHAWRRRRCGRTARIARPLPHQVIVAPPLMPIY